MDQSDDRHDELVLAYLEYFKAYDKWMLAKSVRTYYESQKRLREVIRIARLLNKELQDDFYKDRKRPVERRNEKNNAK